jgi:hypothetical protein
LGGWGLRRFAWVPNRRCNHVHVLGVRRTIQRNPKLTGDLTPWCWADPTAADVEKRACSIVRFKTAAPWLARDENAWDYLTTHEAC